MKNRTMDFAIACLNLTEELSERRSLKPFCNQLVRSASSVGANYRAACRAKSDRDFINKLKIVEEEADESEYWLEIFERVYKGKNDEIIQLKKEAGELVAITVASIKTIRNRMNRNGK